MRKIRIFLKSDRIRETVFFIDTGQVFSYEDPDHLSPDPHPYYQYVSNVYNNLIQRAVQQNVKPFGPSYFDCLWVDIAYFSVSVFFLIQAAKYRNKPTTLHLYVFISLQLCMRIQCNNPISVSLHCTICIIVHTYTYILYI